MNHRQMKLLMKAWSFSKMLLGVLSLVGAAWAGRIIFLKNNPLPHDVAFPIPEDEGEGGGTPKKGDSTQPTPAPPARLLGERVRSPEVNAVLAQVSSTRPPISPPPSDDAKSGESKMEPLKTGGAQLSTAAPALPVTTKPANQVHAEPAGKTPRTGVELPVSILPLDAEAPEVKQVQEVFEQYLKTPSWWERLSLLRSPGRVASLNHRYYEVKHYPDPEMGKLIGATKFTVGEESFIQLAYVCATRWSGTARVNFVQDAGTEPLIDWESFVGYGDAAWKDFLVERPEQPVLMRGYISQEDYYNFEFTDRDRYLSTKVTSPDGEVSVFGFCERHTPEGDRVVKVFNNLTPMLLDGSLPFTSGNPTVPVTLELAFPAKAQSDKCVHIRRVISNRWLLTNAEETELAKNSKARAKAVKHAVVGK